MGEPHPRGGNAIARLLRERGHARVDGLTEESRLATVLTCPQDDLPLHLKRQALEVLAAAFPGGRSVEERLNRRLHDPRTNPVCMLLVEGEQVLAYLAILSTTIEHAGRTYRVSGLSAVSTHPHHLRQGHAARLVTSAREWIEASDADLGVFTCDPPLISLYQACGWAHMPATVVVGGTRAQPFRADTLGKATLMGFFSPAAQAHRSDFDEADVYLDLREGDLW
ncbi:MAG: GNAT family N-acetyltransferase [Dehalococcoidia bacterium]|nr:GNAT family N-acetyltransferase [Dehalococcoidia bacterium]